MEFPLVEIRAICRRHDDAAHALIEILHAIQHRFGHVPAGAVPVLAEALNLSRADVHGVLSFYHDFRDQPAGERTLQVCRAEACQAMNGELTWAHLCRRLALEGEGTTRDGRVTLQSVYCLGNCALSPAIMLDGELHGRVDARRADALLGEMGHD